MGTNLVNSVPDNSGNSNPLTNIPVPLISHGQNNANPLPPPTTLPNTLPPDPNNPLVIPIPPLSNSTLNSIPVNWLPKNPLYTQKAEIDLTIEPNQTLYIRNLNDRVKTEAMKQTLKELFTGYNILDIILMKSFWRRGQAWVIFSTIEEASKALYEFNGFLLYGHSIHINYALEKSYLVSKMNGTYVPTDRKGVKMKPRRIRQRELLYYQSNPSADPSMSGVPGMGDGPMGGFDPSGIDHSMGSFGGYPGFDHTGMGGYPQIDCMPNMGGYGNVPGMAPSYPGTGPCGTYPTMVGGMGGDLERAVMIAQQKANELTYRTQNMVNKTLFVENLPDNVTNLDVVNLFNKMPGYVEARVIVPRKVAFIDFDSENSSGYALQVLQGQLINGQSIKITYAKH